MRELEERCPENIHLNVQLTQRHLDMDTLRDELTQRADAVIAVGGDGTVSVVATALMGADIPLAIIPGGSTNIIAQELGLPNDLTRAAHLVFEEFDTRPLDVGKCNDRYFLHMAGAGWDSEIFATTDQDLKKKVGWLAYVPAALKVLSVPAQQFTFTIDGEVIRAQAPLVLICNGSSVVTPQFRLGTSIRSDDGELDVIILTATKPHELAEVFARLAGSSLEDSPHIIMRRARRISIVSDEPVAIQMDGDVADTTPAEISVVPHGLRVIVPPDAGRSWRFRTAISSISDATP